MTGYHQVEQTYPDQTITDNFRIVRLIRQEEDLEGNCYDWYEIDRHYRVVDRFTPHADEIRDGITETQDALCEESDYIEGRLADIEDALCELTEG